MTYCLGLKMSLSFDICIHIALHDFLFNLTSLNQQISKSNETRQWIRNFQIYNRSDCFTLG